MSEPDFHPRSEETWTELLRRLPSPPQSPFFYERVRARLVAQAEARLFRLPVWLRRPAYALALGALVVAVSGDGAVPAAGGRHPAALVRTPQP